MPHFGPIKRREVIACLRRLGFAGPYAGGKHEFMQNGDLALTIPKPTRERFWSQAARQIAPPSGHPAQ